MQDSQAQSARRASPSDWVRRFAGGIKPGGLVVDVACGGGRHFAIALENGRRVLGIDRDIAVAKEAWASEPRVQLVAADLEAGQPFPIAPGTANGVIVTNYLWRPLLPEIASAVAPDGLLIYETFMVGQEQFGRPKNPEFLLRPGELLDAFAPRLKVIAFEHVRLPEPDRLVQRIAAAGSAHRWPEAADLPSPLR